MRFETFIFPDLATEYRRAGHWQDKSIYEILCARAAYHPDREVFVAGLTRLTYGELKDKVERCAEFLRSIGIRGGDVVTIQLPNCIEFPITFFALELIGALANTVNADFRVHELDYIMRFAGSQALICAREFRGFDYLAMAEELRARNPGLRHVIATGGADPRAHDLDQGIVASSPIDPALIETMGYDAVFRMAFTSGTTGNPKCVLHSFNTTLYAAQQLNDDMQVNENDALLVYLPVGLNWGYLTLLQTILAGARAVLMERFSAVPALRLVERERITYVPTAPASIVAMLNLPDFASYDTGSLRVVVTGGAAAPIETLRAFRQHFKAPLVELFGMLEDGFPAYTRIGDDPEVITGTIGRAAGAMRVRIVDAAHVDVPFGEIGELSVQGPSVHLGYHANEEANRLTLTSDGWFKTGDLGRFVDHDGNIELTGRSKEIINRGGKKFFPREVEEILYSHKSILHAVMIGMPDTRLGESNCLCIVLKDGQKFTLEDAISFLRHRVADYKLPESLFCIDQVPMTSTGKVQRHLLRDMLIERQRAGDHPR